MDNTHRGLALVDILAAGTARFGDADLEIAVGDDDVIDAEFEETTTTTQQQNATTKPAEDSTPSGCYPLPGRKYKAL